MSLVDEKVDIKFNGEHFSVRSPHYSKTISIPLRCKPQAKFNGYVFQKKTILLHSIQEIPYVNEWKSIHERTAKRVWESLWSEGWRE